MDVISSQVGGNVLSGVGGSELPKTTGTVVRISAIVFIKYFYSQIPSDAPGDSYLQNRRVRWLAHI